MSRAVPDLRRLAGARERGQPASGLVPVFRSLPPKAVGAEIIAVDSSGALTALKYYMWDGAAYQEIGVVGGANHNILSATHLDSLAASVVLGDIIHGNATPKWARLAGNIIATKKFLAQTGDGAISAVPAWDVIADADIPAAITRDAEHGGFSPLGHHAANQKVSKSYIFEFPDVNLAVGDFIPENAIRVPAAGKHGTITLGIGYVRCEAAGTGTNTILVRTSTTLTGTRTTRGTIALDTAREAQSADMAFVVSDGMYIWAECSAVGATAPTRVSCQVDAEEASY